MSKNVRQKNPNRSKYHDKRIWPNAYQEYMYKVWELINSAEYHYRESVLNHQLAGVVLRGLPSRTNRQWLRLCLDAIRHYRHMALVAKYR